MTAQYPKQVFPKIQNSKNRMNEGKIRDLVKLGKEIAKGARKRGKYNTKLTHTKRIQQRQNNE